MALAGSIVRLLGLASMNTELHDGLGPQLFVSTYLMVTLLGLLVAYFPGYLKQRYSADLEHL